MGRVGFLILDAFTLLMSLQHTGIPLQVLPQAASLMTEVELPLTMRPVSIML